MNNSRNLLLEQNNISTVRSKAPLRLGIAGGGTDVSPYSDEFGGSVLNATINMYAHTSIEIIPNGTTINFCATDIGKDVSISIKDSINVEGDLILHKAVYKRIMEEFNDCNYIPLRVTTFSDAPPGSGLGSSSTMVVSMLEAYKRLFSLPLGEYDLANLAYEIERVDCGLSGGKQDQYAATFGGFNFIEFYDDNRVIVNPLRVRERIINELEASMVLYYTGTSRDSETIINSQIKSMEAESSRSHKSINAMHQIKKSAYKTKELLLKGDIDGIAKELKFSWKSKKATSSLITNTKIQVLEDALMNAGARSVKISGAGGGGFMIIFIEPKSRFLIHEVLNKFDGEIKRFQFTGKGSTTWTI